MDAQATPIKHLKVFISYTGEDLAPHADVARDVLRRMEWIAVDHRDWAPSGQPSVQACRDKVSECAVLILLVAHRYGWVPSSDEGGSEGKSITRLEYELARDLEIPVVPFIATSEDGWPIELVERHKKPESHEPLEAFKAEIRKHIAAFFAHDPNSLKDKLELGLRAAAEKIVRDATATSRGEVRPPRLSYLCDRSPQSRLVRQRLQTQLGNAAGRPLLLVVHGNSDEAHLAFIKRVEGDVLRKFVPPLSAKNQRRFCHLQSLEIAAVPDFGDALRIAMSNKVEKFPETSNDVELLAGLRALTVRGVFIVLQLCASECRGSPEKLLQTVRDYWQNFPTLPPELLVTCILCVKYDEKPGVLDKLRRVVGRSNPVTPTRKAVEVLEAELTKQPLGHICVLPELMSATRRDVEDLIADVQDELRRHVSDEDYQKWFGGRPALPMDIAINHLDEVLESQPRN